MKELKFRVWHPDDYRIYYFSNFAEIVDWQHGDEYRLENEESRMVNYMQYTGLKDKNGVEIFEGDIVKVNEKDINSDIRLKDTYHVLVVEYFKEEVGFILKNKKTVGKYFGRLEHMFSGETFEQCEIIGNIYENKDLIEVE